MNNILPPSFSKYTKDLNSQALTVHVTEASLNSSKHVMVSVASFLFFETCGNIKKASYLSRLML